MLFCARNPWLKRLCFLSTFQIRRCFTAASPRIHVFTSKYSMHNPSKPGYPSLLHRRKQSHAQAMHLSNVSSSTGDDSTTFRYLSVRIRCSRDIAEMLSEALLCFGASSASTEELSSCDNADETCISSIFTEGDDVGKCIIHAADSIGMTEIPSFEVITSEHCDWVKNVQETFLPVKVTDGLWIIPEWRTPPDIQATNIILNPGLAFGTGEHATTKLCLLLLHRLIKGGEYFLDYGTGSGILGIAALKMGAALSVGIDIDPQAITSARQNATLNNIGPEKMQVHLLACQTNPLSAGREHKDAKETNSCVIEVTTEAEKYDIVIANILLNPLIELADHIVSCAKPGAVVGLSGIISEQIPQVEECYSRFLGNMLVSEMDGWACVSGTKRPSASE